MASLGQSNAMVADASIALRIFETRRRVRHSNNLLVLTFAAILLFWVGKHYTLRFQRTLKSKAMTVIPPATMVLGSEKGRIVRSSVKNREPKEWRAI